MKKLLTSSLMCAALCISASAQAESVQSASWSMTVGEGNLGNRIGYASTTAKEDETVKLTIACMSSPRPEAWAQIETSGDSDLFAASVLYDSKRDKPEKNFTGRRLDLLPMPSEGKIIYRLAPRSPIEAAIFTTDAALSNELTLRLEKSFSADQTETRYSFETKQPDQKISYEIMALMQHCLVDLLGQMGQR